MFSLISVADLSRGMLDELLETAQTVRRHPPSYTTACSGRTVALISRTEAFHLSMPAEVALTALGAQAKPYDTCQIGERWISAPQDLGRILSASVDGVGLIGPLDWISELSAATTVPVVSLCSGHHSPMDALAMLYTIRRSRGKLAGQRLAVIGDGAVVANGALLVGALAGMTVALAHPRGFAPDPEVTTMARDIAARNGGAVLITEQPSQAVEGADVVVVDPWSAKGGGRDPDQRKAHFEEYQVNEEMLASAKPGVMVLHQGPIGLPHEMDASLAAEHMSANVEWAANRVHMSKALFLHAIGRKA